MLTEHELLVQATSDMAYPQRVRIPLADDYYLQHTRHLLSGIPHRRIPISARGEVWYFFKEAEAIRVLLDAILSTPDEIKRKSAVEDDAEPGG